MENKSAHDIIENIYDDMLKKLSPVVCAVCCAFAIIIYQQQNKELTNVNEQTNKA